MIDDTINLFSDELVVFWKCETEIIAQLICFCMQYTVHIGDIKLSVFPTLNACVYCTTGNVSQNVTGNWPTMTQRRHTFPMKSRQFVAKSPLNVAYKNFTFFRRLRPRQSCASDASTSPARRQQKRRDWMVVRRKKKMANWGSYSVKFTFLLASHIQISPLSGQLLVWGPLPLIVDFETENLLWNRQLGAQKN